MNFAGHSAAGRKSMRDEQVQAYVINKSWNIIRAALNSQKISNKDKIRMAMEVVKRTCPQEIDITKLEEIRIVHELAELDAGAIRSFVETIRERACEERPILNN